MKKQFTIHVVLPMLCAFGFHFISGNPPFTLLRYYGSDLCWAYALTASLLLIWQGRIPWILLSTLFAVFVFLEYLQNMAVIPGHGDVMDVVIYALGSLLAYLMLFPNLIKIYERPE